MPLNIEQLVTDVPAEITAVEAVVVGVKKLIADAEAKSSLTVDVADLQALLAPAEAAIAGGQKIVGDL